MRIFDRKLGSTVEAMTGIAVACFMIGLGTLANFAHATKLSQLGASVVLVLAGWFTHRSVELLRAART